MSPYCSLHSPFPLGNSGCWVELSKRFGVEVGDKGRIIAVAIMFNNTICITIYRVKQVWNKILRPGALCWFWDGLTYWARGIQSCTDSAWQCSECFCDTCKACPGGPCALPSSSSAHTELQRALCLATHTSIPSWPALGATCQTFLPFMVPQGLYPSTFVITSSKHLPAEDTSVVIKLTFGIWNPPRSYIISLRVL